jgi:phytanoyl-CoA hydroxylase
MELREKFESQGFVVVPAVLSAAEVRELQAACDEVIRMAEANPKDMFCNYYLPHRTDQGALYDVYQRHPVFRTVTDNPKVLDAVKAVYAEEFYLFENSLVYKPKQAENEVPWHQDYMYMTEDPDKVVAWVAVDDVTEENGCMYGIPGSHKRGALPFFQETGQTHAKRTDRDQFDEKLAQPLLLKAGDMLLFHQFLLHSSRRVPGTIQRRAYRFALKSISNSYTPRATPIVLSRRADGALLKPYQDKQKNSLLAKIGRKIQGLGRRIERIG